MPQTCRSITPSWILYIAAAFRIPLLLLFNLLHIYGIWLALYNLSCHFQMDDLKYLTVDKAAINNPVDQAGLFILHTVLSNWTYCRLGDKATCLGTRSTEWLRACQHQGCTFCEHACLAYCSVSLYLQEPTPETYIVELDSGKQVTCQRDDTQRTNPPKFDKSEDMADLTWVLVLRLLAVTYVMHTVDVWMKRPCCTIWGSATTVDWFM